MDIHTYTSLPASTHHIKSHTSNSHSLISTKIKIDWNLKCCLFYNNNNNAKGNFHIIFFEIAIININLTAYNIQNSLR